MVRVRVDIADGDQFFYGRTKKNFNKTMVALLFLAVLTSSFFHALQVIYSFVLLWFKISIYILKKFLTHLGNFCFCVDGKRANSRSMI